MHHIWYETYNRQHTLAAASSLLACSRAICWYRDNISWHCISCSWTTEMHTYFHWIVIGKVLKDKISRKRQHINTNRFPVKEFHESHNLTITSFIFCSLLVLLCCSYCQYSFPQVWKLPQKSTTGNANWVPKISLKQSCGTAMIGLFCSCVTESFATSIDCRHARNRILLQLY